MFRVLSNGVCRGIASSLSLVEAQRLVRRTCQFCKEEVALPAEFVAQVQKELADITEENWPKDLNRNSLSFYRGKGCPRCGGIGYKGRLVVDEVFSIDETMQELMVNRFPMEKVRAQAQKQGMLLIRQDGFLKAARGLTTVEEVLRATQS